MSKLVIQVPEEGRLTQHRKGKAQKLKLPRRLRQETTITLNWIALRLNIGTAVSLAKMLREMRDQ